MKKFVVAVLVLAMVAPALVPQKVTAFGPTVVTADTSVTNLVNTVQTTAQTATGVTTAASSVVSAATDVTNLVLEGTSFETQTSRLASEFSACLALQAGNVVLDTAFELGRSFAAQYDGGVTILAGQIIDYARLTKELACLVAIQIPVLSFPAPTRQMDQARSDVVSRIQGRINSIREQLGLQKVDKRATTKEIAKAFAAAIFVSINQKYTTEFIQRTWNKMGIKGPDYINNLAGIVYARKLAQTQYADDPQGHSMVSLALASTPNFVPSGQRENVMRVAGLQNANAYVGKNCNGEFVTCLASLGDEKANPRTYQVQWEAGAAQINAQAAQMAQEDVINQAFKDSRPCSALVAASDQKFSADLQSATQELQAMEMAAEKLEQELQALEATISKGGLVGDALTQAQQKRSDLNAEITKATKAYNDQSGKIERLAKTGSSSREKDICKAVTTPAQFVADTVNNAISNKIGNGATYNPANPTLANRIGSGVFNLFGRLFSKLGSLGGDSGQVIPDEGKAFQNGVVPTSVTGDELNQEYADALNAQGRVAVGDSVGAEPSVKLTLYAPGDTTKVLSSLPTDGLVDIKIDFAGLANVAAVKNIEVRGGSNVLASVAVTSPVTNAIIGGVNLGADLAGKQVVLLDAAGATLATQSISFETSDAQFLFGLNSSSDSNGQVQGARSFLPRGPEKRIIR